MSFAEAFGENSAPSLISTRDGRVDLFFKLVRNVVKIPIALKGAKGEVPETNPISYNEEHSLLFGLIDSSWSVSKLDTMRILFNWRDCRGGKGDYWGFYHAMIHVIDIGYEWFAHNLDCIPHFGRFLDLVILWHLIGVRLVLAPNNENYRSARSLIVNYLVERLKTDEELLSGDVKKDISLVAKWLPTEDGRWDVVDPKYLDNTKTGSYKDSFCKSFCKALFNVAGDVTTEHLKKYRKEFLVPLRSHINIVESHIVKRSYEELDYSKVPSVAMKKYRKAFDRNDDERFKAFLEAVKRGDKEIKSDQVYPHDLVRIYMTQTRSADPDAVIEAQWKALREKAQATGAFDNCLVVCDVSGSMCGTPMEVAIALGLLGMNKNRVITFSEDPQLHTIPDGSLQSQVMNMRSMGWGMNTDIVKVYDLVLNLMKEEESRIRRIFIFSDMQFDVAICNSGQRTHFEVVRDRFTQAELEMPQLIFWNLRGNTRDFPVRHDDEGVLLMSGYSPSLLQSLVDGDIPNPLALVSEIVNSERYSIVKDPHTPLAVGVQDTSHQDQT